MKRFLVLAMFLLTCAAAAAQGGKFYTRKAKIEDFSSKTTKVVLSGNDMVDALLREEISLMWHLSPYEFCTVADYDAQKYESGIYFLHFVTKEDVIFLALDKGGKADDPSPLKQGFEIVSIPVCGADLPMMENLCYLSAFINIIQNYTSEAMTSDSKAYSGLAIYNINNLNGATVVLDKEKAMKCFEEGERLTLIGVIAVAAAPKVGSWCYKMLISCDTHELCYFKKHKISANSHTGWLDSDKKRFYGHSGK